MLVCPPGVRETCVVGAGFAGGTHGWTHACPLPPVWLASERYASYWHADWLPPANEAWVKAMLLHLSVSHSVHGGGGLCMMSLPVWLPGPMFLPGGLCPGGLPNRDSLDRDPTPPCTVKSGRYASYWNEFLFSFIFDVTQNYLYVTNFIQSSTLCQCLFSLQCHSYTHKPA